MAKMKKKVTSEKTKKVKSPSKSTIGLLTALPFLVKVLYKGEKEQVFNLARATKATSNKLPKVNLLPPEVHMKLSLHKTKFALTLLGVAIILLSGLLWFVQGFAINFLKQELLVAQGQSAQSQAVVNSYLPIQQFFDALRDRTNAGNAKLGPQMNYSDLLSKVGTAVGGSATVANLSTKLITVPVSDGSAITNANNGSSQCGPVDNPFGVAGSPLVACLAFSGTLSDRGQVTDMTKRLDDIPFLSNVSIVITTQVGVTTFPFTGTATISNEIIIPGSGVTTP